MKKFFIGLAVIGVMAAIAAGALIAVGYSKSKEDSATVNRTVDIEDTFENFDFDIMTTGITVKKASDGKTKVEISENKKCPNEVKVEGNTLKIKQVDQRKWYEKIFGWTWLFEDLKVTVYVAGDTYNTFKCESNTGSINVESGFTFSTLTATNNTGSINLSSNVTGNIQCDNNTGSVNLTGLEAGNINITNDTGSINITDVFSENSFISIL